MNYKECDVNCPFNINNMTSFTKARNKDEKLPLHLENNGSKVLLVFEAPGYYEWENNSPIYDSRNNGMKDSAGSRIAEALEICRKNRNDYDIAEAVCCFPGKHGQLEQKDVETASEYCKKYLMDYVNSNRYEKVVCWGIVAYTIVKEIVNDINKRSADYSPEIIEVEHPTNKNVNQEYVTDTVRKYL